jgi:hypothetical protein
MRLKHRIALVEAGRKLGADTGATANQDAALKKSEGRLAAELIEAGQTLYSRDVSPSPHQLLDWLQIRPFGLQATCVILVSRQPLQALQAQMIRNLNTDGRLLRSRNIIFKLFEVFNTYPHGDNRPDRAETAASSANGGHGNSEASRICWSEQALLEILKRRISLATSGRRDSLTSLFDRHAFADPTEADSRLVEMSHGSLNSMLELGNRIIFHHAQNYAEEPELQKDDFEIIEKA